MFFVESHPQFGAPLIHERLQATLAPAGSWNAPDDVIEANGHEEREKEESDMMGRALALLDKLKPGSLIEIGGQLLKFIRRAGNAIMVDAEGYASMPVSILRLADAKLAFRDL